MTTVVICNFDLLHIYLIHYPKSNERLLTFNKMLQLINKNILLRFTLSLYFTTTRCVYLLPLSQICTNIMLT